MPLGRRMPLEALVNRAPVWETGIGELLSPNSASDYWNVLSMDLAL
jgi:hypothetical protein